MWNWCKTWLIGIEIFHETQMRLQMDFVPHCVAYRFNWYWHSFACFFFAVRVTASKRFQNLYLAWETWRFLAAHMLVYSSLLQIIFRDFFTVNTWFNGKLYLNKLFSKTFQLWCTFLYCRPSLEISQSVSPFCSLYKLIIMRSL